MSEIPKTVAATRQEPAPDAADDEKASLVGWLDYHRATLMTKCAGLSDEQLRARSVPPSQLSLLGLVRHLAEVERGWFRETLDGERIEPVYYSEEEPDGDFLDVDAVPADEVLAFWAAECEHARRLVAAEDDLSVRARGRGGRHTLRWILTHMIEEYARHNGHADLLREAIDGTTGD